MAPRFSHRPVLLDESLALLALRPHALVVDGTVGGGEHAAAILEATAPDGHLIALDLDAAALEAAEQRLRPFGDRVQLIRAPDGGVCSSMLYSPRLKSVATRMIARRSHGQEDGLCK